MDKLNAAFMENPKRFLRTHPVGFRNNSPLESSTSSRKARVDYFDLSYDDSGTGVNLELFASRGKAKGVASNKIKAYWLPWIGGETNDVKLGGDAPYFFTSELTGCRIQIGGPVHGPTVLHIAGDGTFREWRDQQARLYLGDDEEDSRRYSKFMEDGYPAVAFVCGHWDEAAQRWRILAQETDYSNKEWTVMKVREL
jgi:hypothetical protein